jgi:hypothetical protein
VPSSIRVRRGRTSTSALENAPAMNIPLNQLWSVDESQPFARCTAIFVDPPAARTPAAAELSSCDGAEYPALEICPTGQSRPSLISFPICARG